MKAGLRDSADRLISQGIWPEEIEAVKGAVQVSDWILKIIKDYLTAHGYPPSIQELGKAAGLKSPSNVRRHIRILIERGELETHEAQGSPLPVRTPGMRLIDTGKLVEDVAWLNGLKLHCQEQVAEAGSSDDWKRDAEALERVIAALGTTQNDALRRNPADTCGVTGTPCCRCTQGPCGSGKEPVSEAEMLAYTE